MEDKNLLIEINQKLDKICSYIDKVQSPEFIKESEEREFAINVAADLYVEMLEKFKKDKHDLLDRKH